MTDNLLDIIGLAGLLMVGGGLALISVPAALVVSGSILLSVYFLPAVVAALRGGTRE